MSIDPKYCWTCGVKVKRTFITYSYNTDTGEPKQYEIRECANKPKTWLEKLFNSHRVCEPLPHCY